MLRSKTVLIVGAGASKEFEFPVGSELALEIARSLDIRFGDFGSRQTSGEPKIVAALDRILGAAGTARADINPFLDTARKMARAMPFAHSIDTYIDAHQDPDIALLGKLAIAHSIASHESRVGISIKNPDDRATILKRFSGTWLHGLFSILQSGVRRSEVGDLFQNLTIVCFNYDRIIETYLYESIINYFDLDEPSAGEVMRGLSIVHPYGSIGKLGWQVPHERVVQFGAPHKPLEDIASGLRTFTEQVGDQEITSSIRQYVSEAKNVVFLGFSYLDPNMAILGQVETPHLRSAIGTAFGLSEDSCEAIENKIRQTFRDPGREIFANHGRVTLRNDLRCADLVSQFAHSIAG